MQMAMVAIQTSKAVPGKIIQPIMDAVMGNAIIFFSLDDNKSNLISKAKACLVLQKVELYL